MNLVTDICGVNSNSYISLADAETYISDYSRLASSDSWNDLTDDRKKFALSLAAMAINTFSYRGMPCTNTQRLAFPRFTWYQINEEGKTQYKSFFWATRPSEITSIMDDAQIKILNNRLYDCTSSADGFYNNYYNGYIDINQIIKVTGLSCSSYLTIKDIDDDGEYIEVKETITDEDAPTAGVDIDAIPLFGFPDEVGQAQVEVAIQTINTDIFQETIGTLPEPLPMYFTLGGTLQVMYGRHLYGTSKFSKDQTSPLDIVYYLLGPWIAGIGGRIV